MNERKENNLTGISALNKEFDLDIVKSVVIKNWFIIPITIILGLNNTNKYNTVVKQIALKFINCYQ